MPARDPGPGATDPVGVSETPPTAVSDDESLARFVMTRRVIREDGSVKPDAFLPPPDLNLSVTRHVGLSIDDLWSRGRRVAELRGKPLVGRADVGARDVRRELLDVVGFPEPDNPQHAHIVNWPADKPAQKSQAQQLSLSAAFASAPEHDVE